ncbi:MAG TPA: GNAT family N-acetyltransferase [Kofleriaceae bacterium]|nr:GNAT family N-acetyltransferase [Kofleriaceae bacterium]
MTLDLPDEPRWVEAHGIAADPTSWRRPLGGGAAVGHDGAKLAVAYGDADPLALAALVRAHPAHTFLVAEALVAALPRPATRAILHALPDPGVLPDYDGATLLADNVDVPAPLADELRGHRVWCTYVDGTPVAFSYATWRSRRWFDVSVDTLPGARQLGLGTLVAAALIHDERARGREPVWGADEHNLASLRLAARLGFVAVDELWVAPPQ